VDTNPETFDFKPYNLDTSKFEIRGFPSIYYNDSEYRNMIHTKFKSQPLFSGLLLLPDQYLELK
jgi:hypothetical protein